MKQNATLGQTLRYRFDNLMARGAGPQMLLLGGITLVAIVVTAMVLALSGLAPAVGDDGTTESFGQLVWRGLMRTMDSGAVGGDTGSWSFLIIMLVITLVGIFVLSALIGILNGALEGALENLRKGKSRVVESGHTVVLGYTPKVHTLLGELAEAGALMGMDVRIVAPRQLWNTDDVIAAAQTIAVVEAGGRRRVQASEQLPDTTACQPLASGKRLACTEGVKPKLAGKPIATPEPAVTSGMPLRARPRRSRWSLDSASTTATLTPSACNCVMRSRTASAPRSTTR